METVYISVEKNTEVFELYKGLWRQRRVNGIMVSSMTEAIETVVAIFYGLFCADHNKNITAVETHVNRYYQIMGKKVPQNVITCGGVSISLSQRTVCIHGIEIELTNTEFNVLSYLFENRGSALTYEQIYEAVWKEKSSDSSNEAVKSAVKRIRKKLGVDSDENIIIENIWGYGYKVPL